MRVSNIHAIHIICTVATSAGGGWWSGQAPHDISRLHDEDVSGGVNSQHVCLRGRNIVATPVRQSPTTSIAHTVLDNTQEMKTIVFDTVLSIGTTYSTEYVICDSKHQEQTTTSN